MRLTYTIDEAATLLGVSQHKIFQWIHNQELKAFRMGKSLRVPVEDIEKKLSNKEFECLKCQKNID